MKLNLGIRRRLAPLLDNGRDEIELAARDPLLAARAPDPLLRRRDRDGRQRLPRRPRRRPHADAVDGRPQRRLLARRLRPALPAAADGSRLRLPGGERRGAAAHADVAAALAAPLHRAAQGASGVRRSAPTSRSAPATRGSSPTSAATRTTSCSACTTSPARRRRSSSTSRASRVWSPRRCSGRTPFPPIGELPYLLTLAPRGFFWFQLRRPKQDGMTPTSLDRRAQLTRFSCSAAALVRREVERRRRAGRCVDASLRGRRAARSRSRWSSSRYDTGTHDLYQLPLGLRPDGELGRARRSPRSTAGEPTRPAPTRCSPASSST